MRIARWAISTRHVQPSPAILRYASVTNRAVNQPMEKTMKIINQTSNQIAYVVTPSGTVLSGSKIVASGTVSAHGSQDVKFSSNPGQKPIVYLKGSDQYNQGYLGTQVTDENSSVEINIAVINPTT